MISRQIKQIPPTLLLLIGILSCKPTVSFVDPCTGEMVKGHEVGEYKRGPRSFVRVRHQTRDYYLEEQAAYPVGFRCSDLPEYWERMVEKLQTSTPADTIPDSLRSNDQN